MASKLHLSLALSVITSVTTVTKVAESEEIMGHKMHDFLVDFFAERNFQESTESVAAATTHKEWKIRSVSCKNVNY